MGEQVLADVIVELRDVQEGRDVEAAGLLVEKTKEKRVRREAALAQAGLDSRPRGSRGQAGRGLEARQARTCAWYLQSAPASLRFAISFTVHNFNVAQLCVVATRMRQRPAASS